MLIEIWTLGDDFAHSWWVLVLASWLFGQVRLGGGMLLVSPQQKGRRRRSSGSTTTSRTGTEYRIDGFLGGGRSGRQGPFV